MDLRNIPEIGPFSIDASPPKDQGSFLGDVLQVRQDSGGKVYFGSHANQPDIHDNPVMDAQAQASSKNADESSRSTKNPDQRGVFFQQRV